MCYLLSTPPPSIPSDCHPRPYPRPPLQIITSRPPPRPPQTSTPPQTILAFWSILSSQCFSVLFCISKHKDILFSFPKIFLILLCAYIILVHPPISAWRLYPQRWLNLAPTLHVLHLSHNSTFTVVLYPWRLEIGAPFCSLLGLQSLAESGMELALKFSSRLNKSFWPFLKMKLWKVLMFKCRVHFWWLVTKWLGENAG